MISAVDPVVDPSVDPVPVDPSPEEEPAVAPQMVKPRSLTELSALQVMVEPAVIVTPVGPLVPLYVAPPTVMESKNVSVENWVAVRVRSWLAVIVQVPLLASARKCRVRGRARARQYLHA